MPLSKKPGEHPAQGKNNQMVGFISTIWLFINHPDISPFYLNSRLQILTHWLS